MLKKALVLIAVACLCNVAMAAKVWTVGAMGGNDYASVRVGVRPSEPEGRSWIGLQVSGQEDDDGMDAYGVSAVGTWDLISNYNIPLTLPFNIGKVDLATTVYTGCLIGAISTEHPGADRDEDATAALIVGASWGDAKVRFCVEWQRAFTAENWDQLANIEESKFIVGLGYRF